MSDFYIREVDESEFEKCAEVIRQSFATVVDDFGITRDNCPRHTSFLTVDWLIFDRNAGKLLYGLFINNNPAGFVCLTKKDDNTYELGKLAVLPSYRHNGCGRALIDFAKEKVKFLGGNKITIGIIEENTVLKEWYKSNGFVCTGTQKFSYLPFTTGFMEFNI